MAKVTVLVCDECKGQNGVKHYEVRANGEKAGADLCEEHAAPLNAILTRHGSTTPVRTVRARSPRKPTPMSEIEALKKK